MQRANVPTYKKLSQRKLRTPRSALRAGFTLVELLIVISILLVLSVMTIAAINITADGDRIRSAASDIKSYMGGARDRAISQGRPVGVRFIPDASDTSTMGSMIYIGAPEPLRVLRPAPNSDLIRIISEDQAGDGDGTLQASEDLNGNGTDDDIVIIAPGIWNRLRNRNLLPNGTRILVDLNTLQDTEQWVPATIAFNTTAGRFYLTRDVGATVGARLEYELKLAPAVLPNQEPRILPRGIVIDLDNSRVPPNWTGTNSMDILYSPRGTVTGPITSFGTVHLLLADIIDTTQNRNATTAANEGDKRIVSIFTKTGNVSVHSVHVADPGDPADPFRNAETGEVTR